MDIGYLRMMPNLVLVSPSDAIEMKGVLEFALSGQRPVCIRYPKDYAASSRICPASAEPFELGKAVTVKKGRDSLATIISYGSVLVEALAAAGELEREGVEVDVINARFAAPLDIRIMELLETGKRVVTVEDHGSACGFGSGILEAAGQRARGFTNAGRVRIMGAPRRFIRHDSRAGQLMETGVNADKIAQAVRQILEK
jgi:1-deoxy-D-xylulose-5-phosphate synthase